MAPSSSAKKLDAEVGETVNRLIRKSKEAESASRKTLEGLGQALGLTPVGAAAPKSNLLQPSSSSTAGSSTAAAANPNPKPPVPGRTTHPGFHHAGRGASQIMDAVPRRFASQTAASAARSRP